MRISYAGIGPSGMLPSDPLLPSNPGCGSRSRLCYSRNTGMSLDAEKGSTSTSSTSSST